ncbi:MAG: NADPH-dependent assimilatory sulfite reductase hemoprotein subunit [Chthoniobacterales bacterium]|nr:NADPH-dependent assimilatory sulfite reductase hemoprotein subunit [Chthoniobacterales bacterium]
MSSESKEARPPTENESLKGESRFLRGKIAEDLADTSTAGISEDSTKLAKFHGMYMQDDRDLRMALKKAGKEKAFAFMVRIRLPGGRATAAQWLVLDRLAEELASPSLRITTRQTIQFHGVVKGNVKALVKGLRSVLLDSISACGDVNRNVMAPPNPERSPLHQMAYEAACEWSRYALPKTTAYYEIYLDGELVDGGEQTSEPMYGPTYLPRKFKVGFAVPPSNDVDIFSHDLGFIVIGENGKLAGYNVTAGGGQGMSHGNVKTFPRLGDLLGFIPADKINEVARAVLETQRDFGDRTDRKHARLKYTIEDRGVAWFKGEVEKRSGVAFAPARPFEFTTISDPVGWQECADGTWFYGLHVLSGRVKDAPGYPIKTALREIAGIHTGDFRLTPSQNFTISGVSPGQKPVIEAILAKHGITDGAHHTGLRLNALSCVALPTCGLALAESERVLPEILAKFETVLEEAGLRDDAISIRVTGCPNGCARPYLGEIALIGKAPNKYAVYLGANHVGTRLNRLVAPSLPIDGAVALLTPIIKRYALERDPGEGFGDFCDRVILPRDATLHSIGTAA